MTEGTVLTLAEIQPVDGPVASLTARMCAAISLLEPDSPLTIVAEGATALMLPAIALAQRSSHRRVREYVLIEPDLPPVTDSWPDAPVTLVTDDDTSPAARQGALRGWQVVMRDGYSAHLADRQDADSG